MKRSPKAFVWFTNKLQELGYLNELEIEKALSSLAVVKGVVSDEFYISGYEELGWFLSNKLRLPPSLFIDTKLSSSIIFCASG